MASFLQSYEDNDIRNYDLDDEIDPLGKKVRS
jgi:hypothetical protein